MIKPRKSRYAPLFKFFPQLYIREANAAGKRKCATRLGQVRKPSRLDGFTQVRPLLLQAVVFAVDLNCQVSKSRRALA